VHLRALAVLCTLLVAPSCRGGGDGAPISRERFIAANVALRTLPADATDEQRAAVLDHYRASPEELRRWVEAHADEPRVLAEAWQQVATRLDSLSELRPRAESFDVADIPPGEIVHEPVPGVVKDPRLHIPELPEEFDIPRPERPAPRAPGVRPPPLPPRDMVEIQ
jgi:hypothetical protein